MASQNRKFLPQRDRPAEFIASFTSRNSSSFQGILEHSRSGDKQAFRSFLEMLMLMESKVKETGRPHPFMQLRKWNKDKNPHSPRKEKSSLPENDFKKVVTKVGGQSFFIRIMFQQNASYQGEISWLEGQKSIYFRSLLEMIMLIQEALDEACVSADHPLCSWNDEERVS